MTLRGSQPRVGRKMVQQSAAWMGGMFRSTVADAWVWRVRLRRRAMIRTRTHRAGAASARGQAALALRMQRRAMMPNRRVFLLSTAAAGAALTSLARAQARVDEKDPLAQSLGYVLDASKADAQKFKNFAAGQHCGNCAQYQGKPGDAWGPCPVYGGKLVSDQGWCSAWSKKA